MIRRICFYGGPGSGKSTTAPSIFADLKKRGYSVELVQEWIKKMAIAGIKKESFDEVKIFSGQLMEEDERLRNAYTKHIVTDSPVFLQPFYSWLTYHSTTGAQVMMAEAFERRYPSYNIFLDRTGVEFKTEGRYEKDIKDAIKIDEKLHQFLDSNGVKYDVFPTLDYDRILRAVVENLPST